VLAAVAAAPEGLCGAASKGAFGWSFMIDSTAELEKSAARVQRESTVLRSAPSFDCDPAEAKV